MCSHIFTVFVKDPSTRVHIGMLNWRYLKKSVIDSDVKVLCFSSSGKEKDGLKNYSSRLLVRNQHELNSGDQDADGFVDTFVPETTTSNAGSDTFMALAKIRSLTRQAVHTHLATVWSVEAMIDSSCESDSQKIMDTIHRMDDYWVEVRGSLKRTAGNKNPFCCK